MDSSEDSQRGWYTKFWLPAVVGFGAASAGFLWLLYRQLRSLNRTRDLKVMLEILDRHEDPALFKTRHFVYHHMQEVNSFLEELDPTDLGSTDRIDNRIRELSKDEACLEHLLRLI